MCFFNQYLQLTSKKRARGAMDMAKETVTEKSDEVCYVLFLSNKTIKLAHMKRLSKI